MQTRITIGAWCAGLCAFTADAFSVVTVAVTTNFLELAIGYWTRVQTLSVGGCAIVAAGSLLFDLTLVCKAIDADG